jgi:hypothetical protein
MYDALLSDEKKWKYVLTVAPMVGFGRVCFWRESVVWDEAASFVLDLVTQAVNMFLRTDLT